MTNSSSAELRRARRGGRRAGGSGTRQAVLDAARRQFSTLGYDRTTMRSVAAEAGVDQKLVAYFFGSKHALFVSASSLPFDAVAAFPAILGGDPRRVGERLARAVVGMLENPEAGGRVVGLVRAAAAEPEAARRVRDLFTREIWAPAAGHLPDAGRPELVVGLVAAQLLGLVMARYVIRAEPLASLDPDAVIAAIAPVLQRLLSGAAPEGG